MRALLGALLVGSFAVTVGCAEDDATGGLSRRRTNSDDDTNTSSSGSPTNPGSSSGTVTPASVTACAAVAAPKTISDAADASGLRLVGTAIYFQTGASIHRVLKNDVKKTVLTSPNLTRSWADAKGLLAVEVTDTGNPTATLRAFNVTNGPTAENPAEPAFPEYNVNPEGDPGGATAGTGFNAPGTTIFAADDTSYYLQSEDGNGNSIIVAVNRGNPGQQATLVTTDKVITNPQIASAAIWWVQEGNRVFKSALADGETPQGPATEVFGMGQNCSLAVNENAAFCSLGATIEQRDLTGSGVKTFLDVSTSKVPGAAYGVPVYFGNQLFLRNASADKDVKNVIRSVTVDANPTEKLIACNREGGITGIAVDNENVIWSESGKGVFMTTR